MSVTPIQVADEIEVPRQRALPLFDPLQHRPVGCVDFESDVRADHMPAVLDRRIGHGQLQRRSFEVALADREVLVVAD